MYDIVYVGKKSDNSWHELRTRFPFSKIADDFYQAQKISLTKFVWIVWADLIISDNFNFDYEPDEWSQNYVHLFRNNNTFDGVCLLRKDLHVTEREVLHRFFVNKKEVDIVASRPRPYDVFSPKTYDEYLKCVESSTTDMFWVVWNDVNLIYDLDYYIPAYDTYHKNLTHIFSNGEHQDGICLFSKVSTVTRKEFNYRFFINKKEVDIVASYPKLYPTFIIDNYDDYANALSESTTEMFWCIWKNVEIIDNTILNTYFSYHNSYDRSENHVWQNLCNDEASYHGGIILASKNKPISKKEIEHRFIINRKENTVVASRYRYPRHIITNYKEYQKIVKQETSPLFWCIWDNVEVLDESIFDFYFNPTDGRYDEDRKMHHVYKNLCNDDASYHGGVVLSSTAKLLSKKEIDHKFIINHKAHDQIVSRYRYPRHVVKNYDEYVKITQLESSPLFWCIWDNVEVLDESIFDLYYNPTDGRYDEDRKMHHVYKHLFRGDETYHNGVFLATTEHVIGKREFNHKYIITRKEHEQVISKLRPYDIVFISYNEPDADENYEKLLERFPRAKRVHGIKGIHQAHIEAAKLCDTEMVWIVDGDAHILDDFDFSHEVNTYEIDTVHVWQSQNPINDLVYGYGGVKLLPRELTINVDTNSADMTTSISDKFKAMPVVSNITGFNTDEFSTWKSAFRECVKLASKTIKGQVDEETDNRLHVWQTVGKDQPFGKYALAGAAAGTDYGRSSQGNLEALKRINDFDWLKEQFDATRK